MEQWQIDIAVKGIIGEYVAQRYLLSNNFEIRAFGGMEFDGTGFDSSDYHQFSFKGDIRENLNIPSINEYKYWDVMDNASSGYSDGNEYWKEEKNGTVLLPVVYKYFNKEEKNRKNDIFYFKENNPDKWFDFINKEPPNIEKSKDNFFRLNLLISYYIDDLWEYRDEKNKFRDKIKRSWFGGHPGKYDLIGYKNSYYAIEVKLNSSSLSNSQKIRLGLLEYYGFNIMVLNVMMSKKTMDDAINNGIYNYDEIRIIDKIDLSKVKFFDINEFKYVIEKKYKKSIKGL